jgi:hypothetical protein
MGFIGRLIEVQGRESRGHTAPLAESEQPGKEINHFQFAANFYEQP